MSTKCLRLEAVAPPFQIFSYSYYLCTYLVILLDPYPLLLGRLSIMFIFTHLFILFFFLITSVIAIALIPLLGLLPLGEPLCYLFWILITEVVESVQAKVVG